VFKGLDSGGVLVPYDKVYAPAVDAALVLNKINSFIPSDVDGGLAHAFIIAPSIVGHCAYVRKGNRKKARRL
jgi:hypothetical protein